MKPIATLLTVARFGGFCRLVVLPGWGPERGALRRQTKKPAKPHCPHASEYADPQSSRATEPPPLHAQFHPPPLRPADPHPQHLHGPAALRTAGNCGLFRGWDADVPTGGSAQQRVLHPVPHRLRQAIADASDSSRGRTRSAETKKTDPDSGFRGIREKHADKIFANMIGLDPTRQASPVCAIEPGVRSLAEAEHVLLPACFKYS